MAPTHPCLLPRVDPLRLAWAAGLFDGEGTTLAVARSDRPGYLRLEVSVPQCGHDGVPEVLCRFQAAVLGMGSITGPDTNDMYLWRAGGASEAQAAIALMWSQLGAVKREQAARAMAAVRCQYGSGGYRPRRPRRRGHRPEHSDHRGFAMGSPTRRELDLAWAAGFLDGEGHFGAPRLVRRKGGSPWRRIRASASQHGPRGAPAAVLTRLQGVLGGRIERHGDPDDFRWVSEERDRIEEICQLVKPWLGTVKQEQARAVFDIFDAQVRLHGTATHCARGHPYSHVYLGRTGPRNKCSPCDRIRGRAHRARRGIKPRRFKNLARRYNS